jgi:cytochrome c-type biogenesis protein CcsB
MLLWIGGMNSSVGAEVGTHPDPVAHPQWSFSSVGLTPTLNGGRLKPFDSFAREVVLFETGSRSYHKWDSVELVLSWIAFPTYWESKPLIRISREDVRRQLGLDENQTDFAPQELFKNPILGQYAEKLENKDTAALPPGAPKAGPREQELKAVVEKVTLFHSLVTGQGWMVVPKPAPEAWGSLLEHQPEAVPIQKLFIQLLKSYQAGDQAEFEKFSQEFRVEVEARVPAYDAQWKKAIAIERIYNQFRPFLYAWVFYLIAALAWGVQVALSSASPGESTRSSGARLGFERALKGVAWGSSVLAFGSHVIGFGLRCYVAGRPPVTNMYESIIWVSFGVVVFAWILYGMHRQAIVLCVAQFLACFGLIAGAAAPAMLDPSIHPLVPVLRSNYWLTIHVLTITLSYAAFALTFGLANVALFQMVKKAPQQKIATLNQLTYRAMQFGVVFIAAGTILGGIWADYSWGRFWGWDPKEVWALITLLCYLVILHGRYTNWMGQFGFAIGSALSFLSVVMAWYGVNFVLGVGLHSYGFATGGSAWVLGFVGLELLYLLGVSGLYFRKALFKVARVS